jgi:hypothetical protein
MSLLDYDDISGQKPFHRVTEREVLADFARDIGMQPPALDDNSAGGWFTFPEKVRAKRQRQKWAEQNEMNKRYAGLVRGG